MERSVVVACEPEAAFALWTEQIHRWWPLATHSFGQAEARTVVIEPRIGGRIVEYAGDGTERVWGTVTAFDPPHRVAHTWHLGFTPEQATDVEVRFDALPDGATRVTVMQTGFERFGGDAERRRDGNERGWASVLPHFEAALATS